jgi:hypothetical protein
MDFSQISEKAISSTVSRDCLGFKLIDSQFLVEQVHTKGFLDIEPPLALRLLSTRAALSVPPK